MSKVVRCRLDHVARGSSQIVELSGLKGQLQAWRASEVPALLAEAEAAAGRNLYAAGFVTYEAAPAFDEALTVRAGAASALSPCMPLAWFGLFAESHARAALPRAGPGFAPVPAPPGEGQGPPGLAGTGPEELPGWCSEIGAPTHAAAVNAIRDAIADGEVYLVNYTTRFRQAWPATEGPYALYQRLVAGYASGYHAYLETPDWAVACASPELFFELASGSVVTRPMKGTARRGRWSEEDLRQAEALQCSAKERAENVMVVDLLRNDLGRIAVPGSVAVPQLWAVERHPTVWQLTSSVTAKARAGVGLADVFGALFPCGSVTGAPKASAMKIIADLEHSPRGVYCGAVGIVQPGPGPGSGRAGVSARFAVAIRTAVVDKVRRVVEYGSGGGITWDSSAGAEWEEVVVKAKALTGIVPLVSAQGGLLETMAFDPDDAGGTVRNLRGHLSRLASSAAYFGFPPPSGAETAIASAVSGVAIPARVRLVLGVDGVVGVHVSAIEPDEPRSPPRTLCVDDEPVSSQDATLYHKTTERSRYTERERRHPQADDVVLVNQRGEVTETTRANLAVRVGDRWWTPPLDCGLLPGVERARLVARGDLVERVVTLDQLRRAEEVATLSSLRGWRPARVNLCCLCRGPDGRGPDRRGPDRRGPEGRGPDGRGPGEATPN
jgi:para-aminobenzoate synthetase/4-amino-4-deoxychorismate lyase